MEAAEKDGDSSGKKRKLDEDKDVTITAPREIQIVDFASCRMQEILALTEITKTISTQRGAAQKMPRHMRRRAASHNVKRLPRSVREKASYLMTKGGGKPVTTKRPSRKHRRRPGNLMQDYVRRQREHTWLETHIWHAKRFHMCEQWGYKIPLHPNGKSYRACYRSSSNYCVLQDISYMNCIEVEGQEKDLLEGLGRFSQSSEGGSFSAAASLSGSREGKVFLRSASEPANPIGPAQFLWKPQGPHHSVAPDGDDVEMRDVEDARRSGDEQNRVIWLWVHPAMHDAVVKELQQVFHLSDLPDLEAQISPSEVSSSETLMEVTVTGESKSNAEQSQANADNTESQNSKTNLASKVPTKKKSGKVAKSKSGKSELKAVDPRTVSCVPKTMVSAVKPGLRVTLLKDSLCRFSLTGPQSNSILADTLRSANIQSLEAANGVPPKWWQQYYKDKMTDVHVTQSAILTALGKIGSPAELPPCCVVGATVRDPRLFLPPRKIRMVNECEEKDTVKSDELPKDKLTSACMSPIWDSNIRSEVKVTRISDHKLNEYRSRNLVPGTPLNLGLEESRIPVLLIQRPGHRPSMKMAKSKQASCRLGYGSGWDVVVPSGWAMAFWMSLVYRGAHAGALQESRIIAAERGQPHFPEDYPDTPAGWEAENNACQKHLEKYNRMPPAKRPNYTKLGVVAPFRFPWLQLIEEWVSEAAMREFRVSAASSTTAVVEDVAETRDSRISGEAPSQTTTDNGSMGSEGMNPKLSVLRNERTLSQLDALCKPTLKKVAESEVKREHTGHSQLLSSLPKNCLISVFVKMVGRGTPVEFSMICLPSEEDVKKLADDTTFSGPLEPLHHDSNKEQSVTCKKSKKHKQHHVKNCLHSTKEKNGHSKQESNLTDSKTLKDSQTSGAKSIRHSSCREICGFVKHGCFSLSSGHGAGMGFVTSAALIHFLSHHSSNQPPLVLVRSSASLQYRFAYLSVNTR